MGVEHITISIGEDSPESCLRCGDAVYDERSGEIKDFAAVVRLPVSLADPTQYREGFLCDYCREHVAWDVENTRAACAARAIEEHEPIEEKRVRRPLDADELGFKCTHCNGKREVLACEVGGCVVSYDCADCREDGEVPT